MPKWIPYWFWLILNSHFIFIFCFPQSSRRANFTPFRVGTLWPHWPHIIVHAPALHNSNNATWPTLPNTIKYRFSLILYKITDRHIWAMNSPTESSAGNSPEKISANEDSLAVQSSSPNLAFQVQSQDSIFHNITSSIDDRPISRQKRRRTRYASHSTRKDSVRRDTRRVFRVYQNNTDELYANLTCVPIGQRTRKYSRMNSKRIPNQTNLLEWRLWRKSRLERKKFR